MLPVLYPPINKNDARSMYAVGSLATILKSGKVFAVGEIETLLEVEGTDAKANAKVNVTTTTTTTTPTPTTKPNSNKRRKISTQGRVRVRFLGDSSTAHIRPNMLVPHPSTSKRAYYITPTTDLYRRFAKTQGTKEDIFIEVGSDFGQTTSIMSERSPYVVGLDKSDSHVVESRIRYPSCTFVTADVLKNPQCLKDCIAGFPKNTDGSVRSCIVLIDINGNRPMDAVNACVRVVEEQLQPSIVVVKSKELYQYHGGRKY